MTIFFSFTSPACSSLSSSTFISFFFVIVLFSFGFSLFSIFVSSLVVSTSIGFFLLFSDSGLILIFGLAFTVFAGWGFGFVCCLGIFSSIMVWASPSLSIKIKVVSFLISTLLFLLYGKFSHTCSLFLKKTYLYSKCVLWDKGILLDTKNPSFSYDKFTGLFQGLY